MNLTNNRQDIYRFKRQEVSNRLTYINRQENNIYIYECPTLGGVGVGMDVPGCHDGWAWLCWMGMVAMDGPGCALVIIITVCF